MSEEPESKKHEPGGAGGPEGAFALERVEHEMGGVFGPEGATSEELEPEIAFVPESEADVSGEDSSDDEKEPELEQGGQSGAHQAVPAAVRRLSDSFTNALNPSRRVAREADVTLPRSRLRSARWTSTICHQSRPRSAKHRRPGMVGSARGNSKWTGNSRARLA